MILDEFCIANFNLSLCIFSRFPDLQKVLRELRFSKVGKKPLVFRCFLILHLEGFMKTLYFSEVCKNPLSYCLQ